MLGSVEAVPATGITSARQIGPPASAAARFAVVHDGIVLYMKFWSSLMSNFSKKTPTTPRRRQSSGVVRRNSWLWCVFWTESCHEVTGE